MDMDVISRLVLSLDGLMGQFSRRNRRNADDYYHGVHPVSEYALKLHGSTFVKFFELNGIGYTLSEQEKARLALNIEKDLSGYLYDPGFEFQFCEMSDGEISDALIAKSMEPSLEELRASGLGHEIFTTQYLDFVQKNGRAKKRYVAVFANEKSLKGKAHEGDVVDSEVVRARDEALGLLGDNAHEQAFFLTDKDTRILSRLNSISNEMTSVMSHYGVLLTPLRVSDAAAVQKRFLYGAECPLSWRPTLNQVHISKKGDSEKKPGKIGLSQSDLATQIMTRGGTDENLPVDVFQFGDRYFSTFTMVLPQISDADDDRKSYLHLTGRFGRDVNFIISQRVSTDPLHDKGFIPEMAYTAISTLLVGTNNSKIRDAHIELGKRQENRQSASVFAAYTVVVYHRDLKTLQEHREQVSGVINSWNSAQFRSVEKDKLKALTDSVPGATVKTSQHQVFERFSDVIYQSPIFSPGIPYESGYIHFFTQDGQPYPIEEHSPFNLNFNAFVTGTSGGGKSTMLAILTMALTAKPKEDPRLSGELPLKMDIDFGKTSFGLNETARALVAKDKKHLFVTHDFTTGIESSLNPHDLPLGLSMPTPGHKEALVRFLLVLFGNVTKTKEGFEPRRPELESMIMYLVDAVYEYRAGDAQRFFDENEFRHSNVLNFMKKCGIQYDRHHSYYYLADLVVKADPRRGPFYAAILRRYGYPRLPDYFSLMDERPDLVSRFDKGEVAEGLSALEFFKRELGNVLNQFPCFSNVTRLPIEHARMLSFDIRTVVGESPYLKAVFMSALLIVYLVKRESCNTTENLFEMADPIYRPYLERMDAINQSLPGSLNIEEAHIVMSLFNDVIKGKLRQNRKDKWGIRTISQNLSDPDDDYFSLCSSVYITSNQANENLANRFSMMNASTQERQQLTQDIKGRNIFMYILGNPDNRFGINRVGVLLNNRVSPGLLWASANDKTDLSFKKALAARVGEIAALSRLAAYFTRGSVRRYFSDSVYSEAAKSQGFASVHEWFLSEMATHEKPVGTLKSLLEA